MSRKRQTFEICAVCGAIAEGSPAKAFKCSKCGGDISIVVDRPLFIELAKKSRKR